MMKRKFKIGDRFRFSADAVENYGQHHAGKVYTVRQWFDHHASVSQMAHDEHGHPGFDAGAGSALYEAEGLNCAVYEWEMEAAKG